MMLCMNHAIHLAVVNVLYKSEKNDDKHLQSEREYSDSESENSDLEKVDDDFDTNVTNIEVDEQNYIGNIIGINSIRPDLKEVLNQTRCIVKLFRKSPLNNGILQRYVKAEFHSELSLCLDVKTRWNSMEIMIERFLKLKNCIKKALIDLDKINLWHEKNVATLENLLQILNPIKLAVEALSRRDCTILKCEAIITILLRKISRMESPLAKKCLDVLQGRIVERRNVYLFTLAKYLHSAEIQENEIIPNSAASKAATIAYAESIFRRLFPLQTEHLSDSDDDETGCQFRKSWQGRWFQSGVQGLILINSTHIELKGECYEEQGEKYLVYDKSEDCYRCLVLYAKHPSVLQYKETYCEAKDSLNEICSRIVGDATLYSMFRKYPTVKPISCPFKSAPFTFGYNRGRGDCSNPPSRAESCTDDSRLVLKYQACPDVPSTESNVEELVCLATWKEGSTKYLIGKIGQGNRRSLTSDEDLYRCFIYQKGVEDGKTVYSIAQSGDATCSGLQSPTEGSRTMKMTIVDDQHKRCRFPEWITTHHTWVSLDHHKTYKFSQKNATLKILDDETAKPVHQNFAQPQFAFQVLGFESKDQKKQNSEMRLVCHGILQQLDNKQVQIVAHVTAGCDSGYVCMLFYKRDSSIMEIQQSDNYYENPDEACANFDPNLAPFTTLVAPTLHSKKCPHLGRYSITQPNAFMEKRKRREQPADLKLNKAEPECISNEYEGLSVGCSGSHEMEFKSTCPSQSAKSYACHGSWEEDGISYVITTPVSVGRKSSAHQENTLRYCFILQLSNQPQEAVIEGGLGKSAGPPILKMSKVTESCHRHVTPGVDGSWALNFTSNGTCDQSTSDNASPILIPAILLLVLSISVTVFLR